MTAQTRDYKRWALTFVLLPAVAIFITVEVLVRLVGVSYLLGNWMANIFFAYLICLGVAACIYERCSGVVQKCLDVENRHTAEIGQSVSIERGGDFVRYKPGWMMILFLGICAACTLSIGVASAYGMLAAEINSLTPLLRGYGPFPFLLAGLSCLAVPTIICSVIVFKNKDSWKRVYLRLANLPAIVLILLSALFFALVLCIELGFFL